MRIAIVGCGKIANVHLSAIKGYEGATIVAVCDRDRYRAQEFADLTGTAKAYTDFGELLEKEKPDVVHVLTPPSSHADLAIQAMNAGAHALVEKPMALSVAEADRMIEAARANGVKLGANHNYLLKPSVLKAREMVASGEIGEVVYVDSYYGLAGEAGSYAGGGGRGHWAASLPGGPFTNFLPHLTYLQMAFIQDIESVAGVTVGRMGEGEHAEVSDLTVLLQGKNATGIMTVSMRAKPYAKFVDVYGTNGIVRADLVRETTSVHRNMQLPRMLSKAAFNMEDSIQLSTGTVLNTAKVLSGRLKNMPGLHAIVHEFYESIKKDTLPPAPGEDGREVARIMEMAWGKSDAISVTPPPPPVITIERHTETAVEKRLVENNQVPGKVMITGATGFLGHHLARALVRMGSEVVALVRDKGAVSPELANNVTLVAGDLRDTDAVAQAMQGADVVFHCAAITTNKTTWKAHLQTNIEGTEAVLKAAQAAGVKHVVHISSVAVYGMDDPADGAAIKPSAPYAQNVEKWAYYMRSKIEADKLALRYWQEHQLPVTVLRLGILYGPGGGGAPGGGLMEFAGMRFIFGIGRNHLPYTYVGNAVDAMLLAAVTPEAVGQAYNVVDEPQVTSREATRANIALTSGKAMIMPIPSFLLKGASRFFEWRAGADKRPAVSSSVVQGYFRNIRYDTQKTHDELGWQPEVSLQDGIRRTLGQ
jgi:predicted dehydrogenase/nucleoside-diphosphate-sugar epimerase